MIRSNGQRNFFHFLENPQGKKGWVTLAYVFCANGSLKNFKQLARWSQVSSVKDKFKFTLKLKYQKTNSQ